MEQKLGFSFVVLHALLLVSLLGLITLIFELHAMKFYASFFLLSFLIFLMLIGITGLANNFSWAWKIFFGLFGIALLYCVWYFLAVELRSWLFMWVVLVLIAGFFLSLAESGPTVKKQLKQIKQVRYVASKKASTYHMPGCEWANNIKPANKSWFKSREEAKKAGKKPHDCIM